MRLLSQKRHAIDFLFPVTVFFVFTISALTVILLAARIYQSTTDDSQRNYTSGTALSYLTEKLRQNDREDGIFLDELDGTQAVVLRQETADASYLTYLYAWDGQLRELYVKEGTTLSPSAGKSILPVKEFSVEETENQVITFRCTDTSGETATAVYTIRSVAR